jgi:hypothetical protein
MSTTPTPKRTDSYDPIGLTQFESRIAAVENGYNVTPLNGKKPMLNNWQNTVATKEMVERWGETGTGTGMLTATTPVFDIDIMDETAGRACRTDNPGLLGRRRDASARRAISQAGDSAAH